MTYKIFKNGIEINRIVADEDFVKEYTERHGYTYELEEEDNEQMELQPSQLDKIEAQVLYTALMTDTLLEG